MRRDPDKIKRYNKRQLESYISDLKGFTHRSNNFVAGSGGTPLPATLWRQYVEKERKFNATGQSKFDKVADIFLPDLNKTIGQRSAELTPRIRGADGEIANRPYSRIEKRSTSIASVEALKISIKSMERRTAKDYNSIQIGMGRIRANQMLDKIGDKELTERVNSLTDKQFDLLWNYSQFPKELLPKYLQAQVESKQMKRDDIIDAMTAEGNRETANELITWAQELPTRQSTALRKTPRKQGR